jgi:hypothetical protein
MSILHFDQISSNDLFTYRLQEWRDQPEQQFYPNPFLNPFLLRRPFYIIIIHLKNLLHLFIIFFFNDSS